MDALRVGVTGACGYLGHALCRRLLQDAEVAQVVALDRVPWPGQDPDPRFKMTQVDIAQGVSPALFEGLDAVCHLAFVLGSGASDAVAARVDLGGSLAVLEAAAAAGVKQVIISSSVSAYGARPDNPPRLTEESPLRATRDFRYAHHKALLEATLVMFQKTHPEVHVVSLRISTILGPPPRTGAVTELLTAPVLVLPEELRVQFVHVEDVVEAVLCCLERPLRGVFNLAAEPPLSPAHIARLTGQPCVVLPGWLVNAASWCLRRLSVSDVGRVDFLRWPIVVDTSKAQQELGWRPKYDGRACVQALV